MENKKRRLRWESSADLGGSDYLKLQVKKKRQVSSVLRGNF